MVKNRAQKSRAPDRLDNKQQNFANWMAENKNFPCSDCREVARFAAVLGGGTLSKEINWQDLKAARNAKKLFPFYMLKKYTYLNKKLFIVKNFL